jgi:hypothetical protein
MMVLCHTRRGLMSALELPGWSEWERHQDGVTVPCQHKRDVLSVLGVPCQHSRNVLSALDVPCQHNIDVLSALVWNVSKIEPFCQHSCAMSAKQRRHVSLNVPCQQNRDVLSALVCHVSKKRRPVGARVPCQQNRNVLSALDVPCQQKTSGSRNGPGGCNRKSGVVATARNAVQRKRDEREAMDTQV